MAEKFGQLPLSFEANQGQAASPIKFISRGSGYALYLTPTGTILSLRRTMAAADSQPIVSDNNQSVSLPSEQINKQDMLRLRFPGANLVPRMEGLDKLPGQVNYFIGNDPQSWRKDIATYARVRYENLYPGVDMIWYGNQRQLEFDFVVAPGGSPRQVRLAFDGTRNLRLDKRGDLLLRLEGGTIRQHRPIAWQEINGDRKMINARYVQTGKNEIGFVIGRYDRRYPLVIDPVLSWSTYLGGTGSDIGMAIATDNTGVYLTGSTLSLDFPSAGTSAINGGFFRSADNGSTWAAHPGLTITDINTIAIDPVTPSTLYLGTNGFGIYKSTDGGTTGSAVNTGLTNFQVQALAINPSNPAILYAATNVGVFKSANGGASWMASNSGLPVGGSRPLAIDPLNPNTIYAGLPNGVFKSVNGGANWSSFSTGLSTGGLSVNTLAINPLNPNELYAGTSDRVFKSTNGGVNWTSSSSGMVGSNLITALAIDPQNPSNIYAAALLGGVNKSTDGGLNWAQANNGLNTSEVRSLAVDPANPATLYAGIVGRIYKSTDGAANWSLSSTGLNHVTVRTIAVDPTNPSFVYAGGGRSTDAFVAKLNHSGTALLYATYLGGSGAENGTGAGIAVDNAGNAYLTGDTGSPDFPVTPNAYQTTHGNVQDAFVTKLNATGAIAYSTYLGTSVTDIGYGIDVDAAGDIYVTGSGGIFTATAGAYQTTFAGGTEAFLARLRPLGTGTADLIYLTMLGGSGQDRGYAVKTDANGLVTVAGYTTSGAPGTTAFPTTAGAYQTTYGGGGNDVFVAQINPNLAGAAGLVYSTYLGGSNDDSASTATSMTSNYVGLALSGSGKIYLTGATRSINFPLSPGAYQPSFAAVVDAFVTCLNPAGAGAADLLYSTFLGGGAIDQGSGIDVDNLGNAYVIGLTSSSGFPVRNAIQAANGGASDAFIAKLDPTAVGLNSLVYSTYLGGASGEVGLGIKAGNSGQVWVTGGTTSANFPTLAPLQGTLKGQDAFIAKLTEPTLYTPVGSGITVQPTTPTGEATPVTITFGNVTSAGTTSVTTSTTGPPPPSGFRLGAPPIYYELTTTATYTGLIQVCIRYEETNFQQELKLKLFHYENGAWRDITAVKDPINNVICGVTTSLSPFAIFEEDNSPPVVGPISAPVTPIPVNTVVNASADFTDANDADTHTAIWNWDDGNSSNGTVTESNGAGTVTGSHLFLVPGVYEIKLTVTDNNQAAASSIFQYIVVYDPNGGFVTGGGWIESPAGALATDPSLTGKANFGFVSKYHKGATIPTGNTEFQFKAGNFNFSSTSYDWLVVAGAKAQYKGSGKVNGTGDYMFILTATDGQQPGGGGEDKFRIKIVNKATGSVIYDNKRAASDDLDNAQAIGGGNITVHK